MMPRDTNPYGTIFGGVILANIDIAGSIGARHTIARRGGPLLAYVTVAVNRVEFKQPVFVGDVVTFQTRPVRIGRTSITMHIDVLAERGGMILPVTEAEVVYVAVDPRLPPESRQPVSILSLQPNESPAGELR
jgi:acyl-CoA thioesterase YciA